MEEWERNNLRRRLDGELRAFREAAKNHKPTTGLLRAVRQALGIPVAEIGEALRVVNSVVFAFETGEPAGTIQLGTLDRVARAMGCKVVYGIVPQGGLTLEEVWEERLWRKILRSREQGSENREQERAFGSPSLASGGEGLGRSEGVIEERTAGVAGMGKAEDEAATQAVVEE